MFNWKDFIDLAQELISHYDTQYKAGLYRTAISRCYYGIFKQVEDYLDSLNLPLLEEDDRRRKLGSHGKKIYFLRTHENRDVRRFGDKLNDLKNKRLKADYRANENIERIEAERAVKLAFELYDIWTTKILNLI